MADDLEVALEHRPDEHRVAVTAGGAPFTTYRYEPDTPVLSKPVLFPIHAASGAAVTRGYPLEPRPGERVDHDHHVGHSFTYGVDPGVNGVNFWGVSDPVGDDETDRGVIRHRTVERAAGGDHGELVVAADWERGTGETVLTEGTTFRFRAAEGRRTIDRTTTLTAANGPVTMPDDKEGMFAVRVAPGLEHPEEDPIEVVAEGGGTEEVPGDHGRFGEYRSSEGITGREVWGTRAEWMRLSGRVDGEPVSLTVMDHPENPNAPTYWHARGYGLFAANPLGEAVFTDGDSRLDFALEAGESVTFRYRIAVDEGTPAPADLDARREAFVADAP
ncbi:MAG: PmoA family protein [Halobacteriales archaeon]